MLPILWLQQTSFFILSFSIHWQSLNIMSLFIFTSSHESSCLCVTWILICTQHELTWGMSMEENPLSHSHAWCLNALSSTHHSSVSGTSTQHSRRHRTQTHHHHHHHHHHHEFLPRDLRCSFLASGGCILRSSRRTRCMCGSAGQLSRAQSPRQNCIRRGKKRVLFNWFWTFFKLLMQNSQ